MGQATCLSGAFGPLSLSTHPLLPPTPTQGTLPRTPDATGRQLRSVAAGFVQAAVLCGRCQCLHQHARTSTHTHMHAHMHAHTPCQCLSPASYPDGPDSPRRQIDSRPLPLSPHTPRASVSRPPCSLTCAVAHASVVLLAPSCDVTSCSLAVPSNIMLLAARAASNMTLVLL
jgi:hypothetical protein